MCYSKPIATIPRPETVHKKLSICTWNIQGAFTNVSEETTNVKTNFRTVKAFLHKHSVICLTETWANDSTITALGTKGYSLFHSNRQFKHKNAKKDSGGVAVLIRKELIPHIKIHRSLSDDMLWVHLSKKTLNIPFDFIIGAIYLPPENSSYVNSNLIDSFSILEREIVKYKNEGKILLCGDFNSRVGNIQDSIQHDSNDPFMPLPINYIPDICVAKRNNLDSLTNSYGRSLIDLLIGNDLCIINGRIRGDHLGNITCVKTKGVSTVDFNIIEKDIFHIVNSLIVLPLTIYSDHKPLSLELAISFKCTNEESIPMSKCPAKYVFDENSIESFKNSLRSHESVNKLASFCNTSYTNDRDGINTATNDFTDIVKEAAGRSLHIVHLKHRKTPHKPWYTKACFDCKTNLMYLKGMHEKYPLSRQFRENYYAYKKHYKKLLKNSEECYNKNIIDTLNSCHENDSNKFWKEFNKLNKAAENESCIPDKTWYDYYQKLNTEMHKPTQAEMEKLQNAEMSHSNQNHLDYEISIAEIKRHIRKLKNKKSPGLDLISNEMLKYGIELLAASLQKLFNFILTHGLYPDSWKKGMIINLFKSGCKTDPGNYRGITLTSCIGKLFNSILNNRLINYLDRHKLLSKFQAGFRQDHRTTDNVFILNEIMKYSKQTSEPLYMCFIDFTKAFDKLWRMGLLLKLSHLKVGGSFYKVIKDMYSDNSSAVRTGSYLTPFFECQTGVRQGDSLSPTLFDIYVNDICNLFDASCDPMTFNQFHINCMFYADDLVLLSKTKTGLQHCLDRLKDYCNDWYLEVSLKKSKIMIVSKYSNDKADFFCGNSKLEIVQNYKYLGVILSDKCQLITAQESLYSKAIKAYYMVKKMPICKKCGKYKNPPKII